MRTTLTLEPQDSRRSLLTRAVDRLRRLRHRALQYLERPIARAICNYEYRHQRFKGVNERPIEYGFVFRALSRVCPVTVLDIGTGQSALPALLRTCGFLVTATDKVRDYWPDGMFNRHYAIISDDITQTRLPELFDFVTCVSALEHIRDHTNAIKGIFQTLKYGGHAAITFPYNEYSYVPDAYQLPDASYGQNAPYVCQVYSRAQVDSWLDAVDGVIVEQEYWDVFSGAFWACGNRVYPPRMTDAEGRHHLTCLLIRKGSL